MKVNVFEGARRITLLWQILWVIGCGFFVWDATPSKWVNIWQGIGIAIAGWIVIAIVTSVIGWIVRGFLGIPWRSDTRTEPDQKTASPS